MDASPFLNRVLRAMRTARLDAILIGNAAAALQGAPVTTLDFDFMFRKTPRNLSRLKTVAQLLSGQILKPYYPLSDLYRIVIEDTGLQIDFMSVVHGIASFESLRRRSVLIPFEAGLLRMAPLEDIIKSKQALGRSKDRSVLKVLKATLHESKQTTPKPR